MKQTGICFLVAALAISLFFGCSTPGESPIRPAGELPEIISAIPDEEFLAVAYLNGFAFFNSEFGSFIQARFATPLLMLNIIGLNISKDFRDIAIAVGFNSRAFPNYYRSFPTLVVLSLKLKEGLADDLLSSSGIEKVDFNGTVVYQISGSKLNLGTEDSLFVAPMDGDLFLLSTDAELLQRSIEAVHGSRPGSGADGIMADLLSNVDKTATGWLVMRNSTASRNLLNFFPPFDNFVGILRARVNVSLTGVMEFDEAEKARRAVKSYELIQKSLEDFDSIFSALDNSNDLQGRAMLEAMKLFNAKQSGKLAVFTATITQQWLISLYSPAYQDNRSEQNSAGEKQ